MTPKETLLSIETELKEIRLKCETGVLTDYHPCYFVYIDNKLETNINIPLSWCIKASKMENIKYLLSLDIPVTITHILTAEEFSIIDFLCEKYASQENANLKVLYQAISAVPNRFSPEMKSFFSPLILGACLCNDYEIIKQTLTLNPTFLSKKHLEIVELLKHEKIVLLLTHLENEEPAIESLYTEPLNNAIANNIRSKDPNLIYDTKPLPYVNIALLSSYASSNKGHELIDNLGDNIVMLKDLINEMKTAGVYITDKQSEGSIQTLLNSVSQSAYNFACYKAIQMVLPPPSIPPGLENCENLSMNQIYVYLGLTMLSQVVNSVEEGAEIAGNFKDLLVEATVQAIPGAPIVINTVKILTSPSAKKLFSKVQSTILKAHTKTQTDALNSLRESLRSIRTLSTLSLLLVSDPPPHLDADEISSTSLTDIDSYCDYNSILGSYTDEAQYINRGTVDVEIPDGEVP